jgi:hypothetical protein
VDFEWSTSPLQQGALDLWSLVSCKVLFLALPFLYRYFFPFMSFLMVSKNSLLTLKATVFTFISS